MIDEEKARRIIDDLNAAFDALARAMEADPVRPFLDAKGVRTAWALSDEDFREFAERFFERGTAGMRYRVAVESRAFARARGCTSTVQLTDSESDDLDAHLRKTLGERCYEDL